MCVREREGGGRERERALGEALELEKENHHTQLDGSIKNSAVKINDCSS